MAGGGEEAGVGEGGEGGKRAGEGAEIGAGWNEFGSGVEGGVEGGEEFGRPVAVEGKKLRMAGVGELGDGAAAEVMEDIFGEVQPGERTVGGVVGG